MAEPEIAGKAPVVEKMAPGTYRWCSCGRSAKQPFCDGSHAGTEFRPQVVEITEEKVVAWCACKRTCGAPFCDGAHSKL